jgi:hypothetical protein
VTTTLYAPWPVDEFDSEVPGVAPILQRGTGVDDASVAAVQAAAIASFGHPLATTAGGTVTPQPGQFVMIVDTLPDPATNKFCVLSTTTPPTLMYSDGGSWLNQPGGMGL